MACYIKKKNSRNFCFLSSAVLLGIIVLIKKFKDSLKASRRCCLELHDWLPRISLNHLLLIIPVEVIDRMPSNILSSKLSPKFHVLSKHGKLSYRDLILRRSLPFSGAENELVLDKKNS